MAVRSEAGVTSKAGLRAGKRSRHLGGVALLDGDVGTTRPQRGRRSSSARRRRRGRRDGRRARRAGTCRSCSPRRRWLRSRSAPVRTASTSPRAISDPAAESATTLCGTPAALQLPGGQARALQERPRLVHEDVRDEPALEALADRAQRRPDPAGGERARRCSASEPACRARAGRPRERPCGGSARPPRRGARAPGSAERGGALLAAAHLGERPGQVHRGRA